MSELLGSLGSDPGDRRARIGEAEVLVISGGPRHGAFVRVIEKALDGFEPKNLAALHDESSAAFDAPEHCMLVLIRRRRSSTTATRSSPGCCRMSWRGPTRGDVLATGICLGMLSDAYGRVLALIYRATGDASWINFEGLTFAFFLSTAAAALHITAPQDIQTVPRRKSWIALLLGAGLAGFLLGSWWRPP